MRFARLRTDLRLVRDGVRVAFDFGVPTLTGLVAVAELLGHDVYEVGSLQRTTEGVRFLLRNPPLRMGAFSGLKLFVEGQPIPPPDAQVIPGGADRPVRFSEIDRAHPVTLPIGQRTAFHLRLASIPSGPLHLRLELQSVAIPPLVWLEFTDAARPADPAT
jgi:hypothetical protein